MTPPCRRRAIATKPNKPEPNSQTAAGIGTATFAPGCLPNEKTTLEITVLAVAPANASVHVAEGSMNRLCGSLSVIEPLALV